MKTRRQLLKEILFAFPALALAAAPVWAVESRGQVRRLTLCGFERHQGRALWPVMQVGDPLSLRTPPKDESTPQAIAVYWGEFLIGHASPADCTLLEECMARGEPPRAAIAELCDRRPADRGVVFAVWLPG